MLTPVTQITIALISDIANDGVCNRLPQDAISFKEQSYLLSKLEARGLIRLKSPNEIPGIPSSYQLTRPYNKISLLDILEATGEHLNCNHPTTEEFYMRYGNAAKKLGVVNHMTRLYLEELKLNDL